MHINHLIGEWINPRGSTDGIEKFNFHQDGNSLLIEIFGSESSVKKGSWGKWEVKSYAPSKNSDQFSAFHAISVVNDTKIVLAGNINKGLIIIALYATVDPTNGDSNYFIREFFYHNK